MNPTNPTRLDELADGIFAIVMTVLVFDIKLPYIPFQVTNLELWDGVKALIPSFGSYILCFALLFTYWRAHHFFTSVYAKNIDAKLMNINVVFFFLITLIPFSSFLLGHYSTNELAVVMFSLHVILIGLCLYWMRRYVLFSKHIQNPEISEREIKGSTIRTLAPVFFALIAIPLAFLSTKVSVVLLTLGVIFNLLPYSTSLFLSLFHREKS